MRKRLKVQVPVALFAALAGVSALAATWNVKDGWFGVPENWNPSGVPTDQDGAIFNASGAVRFPVVVGGEPYRTTACIRSYLPLGSTFTFDSTGGMWLMWLNKKWTVNDQQAFILNVDGKRLFGLTGVNRTTDEAYPLLLMSNAVLRIDAAGASPRLLFERGEFDFARPLGEPVYSNMKVVMLDAAPAGSQVVLQEGATFRCSTAQVQCGAEGSALVIAGGAHHMNLLQIGTAKNAASESLVAMIGGTNCVSGSLCVGSAESSAGRLTVSGGLIEAAAMFVGNAVSAPAAVELSGDARIVVTNLQTGIGGGAVKVSLSGNAALTTGADGATVTYFNTGSSETTLTLDDNAVFESRAQFTVNKAGGSTTHIAARGSSKLISRGNLTLASGAGGTTEAILSEDAILEAGGSIFISNNDTSTSMLAVQDNATIVLTNAGLYVGWTRQQPGVFAMTGGHVAATNSEFCVYGGKSSSATISGGVVDAAYFTVQGANNAADDMANTTNSLVVSGGRHRAHYVAKTVDRTGLVIGSNAKACVCEISGGELTVPQRVRLQAKAGGLALLRVSGGRLSVENSAGESIVSLGHAANVFGRLEMTGGEIVADKIVSTSGNGASLLSNGGRLTLNGASESDSCLQNIDTVELGQDGMTVCVDDGKAGSLSQTLVDAANADGLFVKTGDGSLLVGKASVHAKTRIDAGKLKVGAEMFGREVVVAGGVLSLEGAATELSASRVVFGDGTAPGTLRLDQGDVLTADELVVNGLVVDMCGAETNKTYSFLSTKTDSVDMSKISFANASPLNDYRFMLDSDGDGGHTLKLAVEPRPTTEHVWTGGKSSDWQTVGNWTGGVPGLLGNAVFGAVANSSVRIDSAAEAASLSFTSGTDYTFAGGGSLAVYRDVTMSAGGSATFAPPVALTGDQTFDLPAGSRLAFDGGLAGDVMSVAKSGPGELSIGGETIAFNVWTVTGGRLSFTAPLAFGAGESPAKVTIGPATMSYAGDGDAVMGGGLAADPGAWRFAIANVTSRMTVGNFSLASGGFLKTGAGELVLDLPAGVCRLPAGTKNDVGGSDPVVLPDSGDSPDMTANAQWNNLSSFTVLEGRLTLKGRGADKSVVNDAAFLFVGSDYAAARANAELVLDGLTLNQGGSGMHLHVGHLGVTGGGYNEPKLIVRNGARLVANGIYVSCSKNDPQAKLAAELTVDGAGSAVVASYSMSLGINNAGDAPRVIVRDGGLIQTPRIGLNRNVSMTVCSNGRFEQTSPSPGNGGLGFGANGHGTGCVTVSDGGVLRVSKLYSSNWAGDGKSVMTNDGGLVEFLLSDISAFAKPSMCASGYQTLVAGPANAAFAVGSGLCHEIAFPITGPGAVVKRGDGTLVIGRVRDVQSVGLADADIAGLQNAGGIRCEQGTLVVTNGAIAAAVPIDVSAGARVDLDGATVAATLLSGAGTVARAALSKVRLLLDPLGAEALALEDVALPARVDIVVDVADDYVFNPSTPCAVVRLKTSGGGHPATVDFSGWKVRRASGKRVSAAFAYDPETGIVTAILSNAPGFMLVVS